MTTLPLEAPVSQTQRQVGVRRLPGALVAALCGGVYGAGLARWLFESQPQRLNFFTTGLGVGALALLCGGVLAVVCLLRFRRLAWASFAPLALLLPLVDLLSPDVNLLRAQTLLLGAPLLFASLLFSALNLSPNHSITQSLNRCFPPLALCALLFVLYLRTVAPTVGEADTFEYQVAAARLGIAHGSGYPLLILLGRLFAELPLGGAFAFRVNLAGAFSCCLAAVLVERLARRLGASALPAFLAGLAYGVSPLLWVRAVGIETHPLNAAFLAALLYLCIELIDRPVSPRWLYALAFVFGLGLTSHLTIVLLAPACAVAAAWWLWRNYSTRPSFIAPPAPHASRFTFHVSRFTPHVSRFTPHVSRFTLHALRFLLPSFLFCLLGLSVFLYIPLRWPAVNHGELLSLEHFIYILKGGEAPGSFDPFLPFHDVSRFAPWLQKIVGEYSAAGFAVALAGAAALVVRYPLPAGRRKRWAIALVVALMFAGHSYFALAYNTREPDWSDFFITVNVVTAVLMGLGLQAILDFGSRIAISLPPVGEGPGMRDAWLPASLAPLLLSAFSLIPLGSIWNTLPKVDRSQAWDQYRLGQYTLQQPLAQGAVILADPAHLAPLFYLQVVEKVRPDLDIVILPGEDAYRAVLDESLAAGKTVYLGRYLSGLGSAYSLRSVGPLTQVSPQPFTAPVAIAHPLSDTLGSTLRLLGYRDDAPALAASGAWPVTLFWRTDVPADNNYLVSLRLVDAAGQVAWQSPERVPAGGLYPTNAWKPGETVADFYLVPILPTLAPGDYRLEVGLFPPFHVSETGGWAFVTSVAVKPSAQPPVPARLLRMQLGQQWLMGYDLPQSVAPGSTFKATLYWLRDAHSQAVTAFGETRSLAAWPVGSLAPQTYRLTAPLTGSQFTLSLAPPQPLQAACGWLRPAAKGCSLPSVRLAGEARAAGSIIFGDQILLRKAALGTTSAKPGDSIDVTLEWQALQSIGEDYTVFVHLVGPDGKLYGQVDFFPVGGTERTSQWTPGQVIVDPYRVPLSFDAPPGQYAVHVGFYLLATMERLPVLNAEGTPVDDHALLTGLTVH